VREIGICRSRVTLGGIGICQSRVRPILALGIYTLSLLHRTFLIAYQLSGNGISRYKQTPSMRSGNADGLSLTTDTNMLSDDELPSLDFLQLKSPSPAAELSKIVGPDLGPDAIKSEPEEFSLSFLSDQMPTAAQLAFVKLEDDDDDDIMITDSPESKKTASPLPRATFPASDNRPRKPLPATRVLRGLKGVSPANSPQPPSDDTSTRFSFALDSLGPSAAVSAPIPKERESAVPAPSPAPAPVTIPARVPADALLSRPSAPAPASASRGRAADVKGKSKAVWLPFDSEEEALAWAQGLPSSQGAKLFQALSEDQMVTSPPPVAPFLQWSASDGQHPMDILPGEQLQGTYPEPHPSDDLNIRRTIFDKLPTDWKTAIAENMDDSLEYAAFQAGMISSAEIEAQLVYLQRWLITLINHYQRNLELSAAMSAQIKAVKQGLMYRQRDLDLIAAILTQKQAAASIQKKQTSGE
jgi:hypothetical protein